MDWNRFKKKPKKFRIEYGVSGPVLVEFFQTRNSSMRSYSGRAVRMAIKAFVFTLSLVLMCLVIYKRTSQLTSGSIFNIEFEMAPSGTSSFYFEPIIQYTPQHILEKLAQTYYDLPALEEFERSLSLPNLLKWSYGSDSEQKEFDEPQNDLITYYRCKWLYTIQLKSLGLQKWDRRCNTLKKKTEIAALAFNTFPSINNTFESRQSPSFAVNKRKEIIYNSSMQVDTRSLLQLDQLAFGDENLSTLSGFRFCPYLSGSFFFHYWNVSVWATNPLFSDLPEELFESYSAPKDKPWNKRKLYFSVASHPALVVQLIDYEAQRIYDLFWEKVSEAKDAFQDREEPIKRFACFMAALGNNAYSNIVDVPIYSAPASKDTVSPPLANDQDSTAEKRSNKPLPRRLLATIHPDNYFPDLGFSVTQTTPVKKHYRVAYLLIVHAKAVNTMELIKAVHSNSSFILVHVDAKSTQYKQQLRQDLVKLYPHPQDPQRHVDNIQVMDASYDVLWGHISIVWAELRGFFELLDRCEFDFVVNLSGHDYPLVSSEQISRLLRPFENFPIVDEEGVRTEVGVNFVFDIDSPQAVERISYPTFITHDPDSDTGAHMSCWWFSRDMAADLDNEFPTIRKTSQWMVVHRSLINHMRKDYRTRLLLAYLEHSMVPDESFFVTYVLSTPLFSDQGLPLRRSNNPKRLIYWGGDDYRHPKLMKLREDRQILQEDSFVEGSWFIRKVDVKQSADLQSWIDDYRNETLGWQHYLPPSFMRRYYTMVAQLNRPSLSVIQMRDNEKVAHAFDSEAAEVSPLGLLKDQALNSASSARRKAYTGKTSSLLQTTRQKWNFQRLQYVENFLQVSAYSVSQFLKRQMTRQFSSLVIPVRAG